MSRPLLVLACLLTAAAAAVADSRPGPQVTARQGLVNEDRRFKSPMVLETALPVGPGFSRTSFGAEIADFTCDDVSLQDLSYQVRGNRKNLARPTELAFAGWVVVPNSFDREVDVVVTIRHGNDTLGSQGRFRISAEEGRRTPFSLKVPVIRLRDVTDGAAAPVVEITLTVRDNS